MNDKLTSLMSKRLGFSVAAGYVIWEMGKQDTANMVYYAGMIAVLGATYILAETICKFASADKTETAVEKK